jgi:hypothetical protein
MRERDSRWDYLVVCTCAEHAATANEKRNMGADRVACFYSQCVRIADAQMCLFLLCLVGWGWAWLATHARKPARTGYGYDEGRREGN